MLQYRQATARKRACGQNFVRTLGPLRLGVGGPSDLVQKVLQLITILHPQFLQGPHFDLPYPLTTQV
jgi:hypothetical protein